MVNCKDVLTRDQRPEGVEESAKVNAWSYFANFKGENGSSTKLLISLFTTHHWDRNIQHLIRLVIVNKKTMCLPLKLVCGVPILCPI